MKLRLLVFLTLIVISTNACKSVQYFTGKVDKTAYFDLSSTLKSRVKYVLGNYSQNDMAFKYYAKPGHYLATITLEVQNNSAETIVFNLADFVLEDENGGVYKIVIMETGPFDNDTFKPGKIKTKDLTFNYPLTKKPYKLVHTKGNVAPIILKYL